SHPNIELNIRNLLRNLLKCLKAIEKSDLIYYVSVFKSTEMERQC
ncbi:MAG: hypothetical protein H6Q55_2291, partial [Deltaproteobacteria bacterium]|nr:hypothetical protein [Deltaproteobacteria bacterium]